MVLQYIYYFGDGVNECSGPVIRINPHEIHVEDSSWIDVLYVSHGHVRKIIVHNIKG